MPLAEGHAYPAACLLQSLAHTYPDVWCVREVGCSEGSDRAGKKGRPEPVIAKISPETLAEMIGTTRSRVTIKMGATMDERGTHLAFGFLGRWKISIVHASSRVYLASRPSSVREGEQKSCR